MLKVSLKVTPDFAKLKAKLMAGMAAVGVFAREEFLANTAAKILATAKKKSPVLWGDLQRSGIMDREPTRTHIAFGGDSYKKYPPSEYAELQHEDETIAHRGPRMKGGVPLRYVYLYLKTSGVYAPRAGAGGPEYAKRDLASEHPKRGQVHFLFDSRTWSVAAGDKSALGVEMPKCLVRIDTWAERILKSYLK